MLQDAVDFLLGQDPETPYEDLADRLKSMGFEPGWGHDAARILSTMELLNSILDNPDHEVVSEFFSRIPMVHRIAIITPHGWFAQENVLGRPDTGGQIVYILNQVKALENELIERIRLSGLDLEPQILIVTRLIPEAEDTRCNVAYEPVDGTKHTHILRVPFREHNKAVTDRWISRFDIWALPRGVRPRRGPRGDEPFRWPARPDRGQLLGRQSRGLSHGSRTWTWPSSPSPTLWRRPSTSAATSTGRRWTTPTTSRSSSPRIFWP